MTEKRKQGGRRASDAVVTIRVEKKLDASSLEVQRLVAELNKGRSVKISSTYSAKKGGKFTGPISGNQQKHTDRLSFSEIATILGGGAALGLASLALAPASATAAGIAAIVGVGVTGFMSKNLDTVSKAEQ